MSMDTHGVIEFALEKEVMARRLYEFLAEQAGMDEARMMFLELVSFEAGHIDIFVKVMAGEIKRLNFDVKEFLDRAEAAPFHMPGGVDEKTLQDSPMEDILKTAKKFEKQMSEFYREVAAGEASEEVKAVGTRLSKEELDHFDHVTRIEEVLHLSIDEDDGEFHAQ